MARKNNYEGTGKIIEIGKKVNGTKKEISPVCKNIRKYREQIGMEQKELSLKLGQAASSVGNWERGFSKPNLDLLTSICNILGITLYELFGINDPLIKYTAKEQSLISDYRELSDGHKIAVDGLISSLAAAEIIDDTPDLTKLIYFTKQLAAGIGDPTDIEDNGEPIFLHSSTLVNKADYVFTVNGDSMEPEYHNGDMVLIKSFPDCDDILPGEMGAFIYGNEAYIKEYQADGLHSLNKEYDTIQFTEDDKVYFIGKVIGVLDDSDLASDKDIEKYLKVYGNEI